jgi:hypothetical protein
MARAITPEIQVVEETGASLSQGATGGDARTHKLACSSWATIAGLDADFKDDEEAEACHTLECGMTWAHRAFDELILPATSVSFLVRGFFFDSATFSSSTSCFGSVGCRRSNLRVGSMLARCSNSTRSGPNWRCSLS